MQMQQRDTMSSDVKRPKRGVSPGADPSRVIFVREIQSNTSEYELRQSFENYGRVTQVFLMPQRRQALVEFATLLEADDLVRRHKELGEAVIVREHPVAISFSKQAQITEPKKEYLAHGHSNILLFTMFNVRVDIDCETFRKIGSPFGQLERVTLFKNAMDPQAIIEFSTIDEGAKAKPQLNGADIYANCNTLRCEYVTADVFKLVIRDPRCVIEEWMSGRQTTPAIPGVNTMQQQQPQQLSVDPRRIALFDGPPPPRRDLNNSLMQQQPPMAQTGAAAPGATAAVVSGLLGLASQLTALNVPGLDAQGIIERLAPLTGLLPDQLQQGGVAGGAGVAAAAAAGPPGVANQRSNNILFLSGLSERLNCDHLFNVLCLYGNVRRIKFFANTRGQAMAEMLDSRSADACVHYLHNCQLLGKRLIVDYSRQRLLKDVRDAMPLPDGSPSVKDFDISGRNCRNRFMTPEMVKKNKLIEPSSVLYFWGSQPEATEQDVARLLETAGAPQPERIQFLNSENKSGFLFYANPCDALDAVCLANHSEMPLGDRNWLIRMSFSLSRDGSGSAQRGAKRMLVDE